VTTPEPPPEARLIAELREAMIPPLSMREAARRADMSPALWASNEQGRRKVTSDVVIPIRATDEKLAHMALVVGATPEQLTEAGRPEAAKMLAKLIEEAPDEASQLVDAVKEGKLTERQKNALIDLIHRKLD